MTYTEWKKTLTDAHWDKIYEAILLDQENNNCWADDNEYLIDIVTHYHGKPEFIYDILDEYEKEAE